MLLEIGVNMPKTKTTEKLSKRDRRWEKIRKSLNRDFRYCGIDYDYTDTGCLGYCNDPYCHCSEIRNAHVTSVNVEKVTCHFVSRQDCGSIFHYAMERILTALKIYEPDAWDIGICSGYYGQEIRNVTLDETDEIEKALRKLNECKSEASMVKLALEFEYGYILERLKGLRKARVEKIDIDDIEIGAETYAKKVDVNESRYEYRELPFCLCVVTDGEIGADARYRIIDGYHRYSTAKKMRKKKIPIVILH